MGLNEAVKGIDISPSLVPLNNIVAILPTMCKQRQTLALPAQQMSRFLVALALHGFIYEHKLACSVASDINCC